jgi:hypothetical protein
MSKESGAAKARYERRNRTPETLVGFSNGLNRTGCRSSRFERPRSADMSDSANQTGLP